MKNTNGKIRIQFNRQEISAIRCLVLDSLGEQTKHLFTDETLGSLLVKTARAAKRIKALG